MKKHVVSRIPSPLQKSAPVQLGDCHNQGRPRAAYTSKCSSASAETFIPLPTPLSGQGPQVPGRNNTSIRKPVVSPRGKSAIPKLPASNFLRVSHESFFGKRARSQGKKETTHLRKSKDLTSEEPIRMERAKEDMLSSAAVDVRIQVPDARSTGNDTICLEELPGRESDVIVVSPGGECGDSFGPSVEDCIPGPPSEFRDSKTPSPCPSLPNSPIPAPAEYTTELSDEDIPDDVLISDKKDRSVPDADEIDDVFQIAATKLPTSHIEDEDIVNGNDISQLVLENGLEGDRKREKTCMLTPPGTLPKPSISLRTSQSIKCEEKIEEPSEDKQITVSYMKAVNESRNITETTDHNSDVKPVDWKLKPKHLQQFGSWSSLCASPSKESTRQNTTHTATGSGAKLSRCYSFHGSTTQLITDSKHPIWFVNPDLPGYVGFANLPNQVHRKSVKKGFEFTLLVVGESGLGKSTLINSLFLSDLYPDRKIPNAQEKIQKTVSIEASTVEIEERGVKLRLTVVDTPGFADSINNTDSFKNLIKYVDDQFDKYLSDESGLNRRNIVDNRVHCCFYFINPAGHGLKPLDIAFMKAVDHKVNIVPVIAKADTLTVHEIRKLKKKVLSEIERFGIQIYTLPDCDDDEDEEYKEQCRQLKEAVPFAVVGSTQTIEVRGKKVRGRLYPWGVVEVENPDHCDFIKLRTMLITHMQDLQEVTQEVHYENFRGERLSGTSDRKKIRGRRGSTDIVEKDDKFSQKELELAQKEAELRRMQEMLSKMQAEMSKQKSSTLPATASTGPGPTQMNNNNAKAAAMNGATLNMRMNGAPPPPPSSKPPVGHQ